MPFVAINRNTKERVDITEIEKPRSTLQKGDYICPLCSQDFVIKAGLIKAAHFAHKAECSASDWKRHQESIEHLYAKKTIPRLLRKWADYNSKDIRIEREVPISEIKRVADVLVTFPTGWRVVHEIQFSSITTEELQDRTNDYESLDIDVCWWLGKKADTEANRLWCEMHCYGYCTLEVYEEIKSTTI